MDFLTLFIVVFIGAIIFYAVGDFAIKNADNRKPLKKAYVKILEKKEEKLLETTKIERIVVEKENRERLTLKNVYPGKILIAVGDEGYLEYRGETIQQFHHSR